MKIKGIKFFLKLCNDSLRKKLLISYIFSVIIPVLIIVYSLYSNSEKIIKNKIIDERSKVIELIKLNIDKRIEQMKQKSNYIVFDKNLVKIISQSQYYSKDLKQLSDLVIKVNQTFDNIHNSSGEDSTLISIINNDNFIFRNWGGNDKDFCEFKSLINTDIENENMYIHFIGANENYSEKAGTNNYVFTLWRNILDNDTNLKVGEVFVSIKEDDFFNTFASKDIKGNENIYLVDAEGISILSNNKNEYGKKIAFFNEIANPGVNLTLKANNVSVIDNEKSKYILNFVKLDEAPFMIVEMIRYSDIFESLSLLFKYSLTVLIICTMFFLVASILISKGITYRINKLNKSIEQVQKGELTAQVLVKGNDEIKKLADSYNYMLKKINELIKQVEREQIGKREAEINMLQAQIKPHFLFNTLNSLKWMAVMSQANSLCEAIEALSEILKSSIINTNSLNTLKEEIKNLENYVIIQKIRYGNLFEFNYSIEEPIMCVKLPRFLLQPIIENSIIHGFSGINYKGRINLNANIEDSTLFIEIHDNGIGIEPEKLEGIVRRREIGKGRMSEIGVWNVNERIKLNFGERYGLTISSPDSGGTLIKICLPGNLSIEEV